MSSTHVARALGRAHLQRGFEQAGIGLKLLGGPLGRANADIVQMDIHQTRRFPEYVRIWPGAEDNEVEVLGISLRLEQLVLRVKEPRRAYTDFVHKTPWSQRHVESLVKLEGARVVREFRTEVQLERWTSPKEHRYLVGRDDIRLFIAEIESGFTVSEAHRALKPRAVLEAEARGRERVLRQGEWFFVPLGYEASARLEERLSQDSQAVKSGRPVGRVDHNRPHVADELVRVSWKIPGRKRRAWREEICARGRVRHGDHRTLLVPGWRRVVLNREVRQPWVESRQSRWID